MCCLFTENHNKDNALFKAVQTKFGNSIPRSACLLFVKCCPVCIGQVNIKKKKVAGFFSQSSRRASAGGARCALRGALRGPREARREVTDVWMPADCVLLRAVG